MEDSNQYRCRLIYLKPSNDPASKAQAASEALAGIEGILLAAEFSQNSIHVIYSLHHLSFDLLTELLAELGFETDNSILISLRNTIYVYLEDNARDNLNFDISEFQEDAETPDLPSQTEDQYWEDYR